MDLKYLEVVTAVIESAIISNFVIKSLEPRSLRKVNVILYVLLIFLLFIEIRYTGIIFQSESVKGLIQMLICLIFSILFLGGTIFKKLLISIISNLLILIINTIILSVMNVFLDESIMEVIGQHNAIWLFAVIMSKLLYFLITYILLSYRKKITYHITFKEGGAILIIFFVTLLIGLSIMEMNIVPGNYENKYLIISIFGLMIINILSFYILSYLSKEHDKKIRYYLLEIQVENQKSEINELQNKYGEILKLRHDFKNYILCGLTLLRDEKIAEAEKYFNSILGEKLKNEVAYIHTNNNAVNAILNAKLNKCRKIGITTNYKIVNKIEGYDIDLSILFANLFDNAIEACLNCPDKSMIELSVGYEKAYLNIVIKNTIEKPVLLNNPDLLTTKKDKTKHGYGLQTVDEIVKKYDGIKKFYEKENWFYADIWIKLPFMPESDILCQKN